MCAPPHDLPAVVDAAGATVCSAQCAQVGDDVLYQGERGGWHRKEQQPAEECAEFKGRVPFHDDASLGKVDRTPDTTTQTWY